MERPMNNLLSLLAAAAALTVGLPAINAEVVSPLPFLQAQSTTAPELKLTMEQRHIIKEIVLKDLKPAKTAGTLQISVGDSVPAGVDVQPFPADISQRVPQIKAHAFFVTGEHVVVVS